jgi:hypothetical protein
LIEKVGTGDNGAGQAGNTRNISNPIMDKGSLRDSLKYLLLKELENNST